MSTNDKAAGLVFPAAPKYQVRDLGGFSMGKGSCFYPTNHGNKARVCCELSTQPVYTESDIGLEIIMGI